jgi:hypothetical protein
LLPFAFQHGNQLRSAKQMKHCLGGYHRHLLRNTASFCLVRFFTIFEREKSFEMSARRNAQATT